MPTQAVCSPSTNNKAIANPRKLPDLQAGDRPGQKYIIQPSDPVAAIPSTIPSPQCRGPRLKTHMPKPIPPTANSAIRTLANPSCRLQHPLELETPESVQVDRLFMEAGTPAQVRARIQVVSATIIAEEPNKLI